MFKLACLFLATISLIPATSAGPIAKDSELHSRAQNDTLDHGNYVTVGGSIWRYHQIADGLYVGVPPDQWDDTNNSSGVDLTLPQPQERDLDIRGIRFAGSTDLVPRALNPTCKVAFNCVGAAGFVAGQAIGQGVCNIGSGLWTAIQKIPNAYGRVMDVLNQPFFANFAGVGGQNIVVTVAVYEYFMNKNTTPQSCSDQNSQLDTLQTMLQSACATQPEAGSLEQTLTYSDGSTVKFIIQAAPGNSVGNSPNLCGGKITTSHRLV